MNEQQQARQNNTCLDAGQIIAWHDGALPPQEADAVMAHLAVCARCTAEERALMQESRQVIDLLSRLDPPSVADAKPVAALARFRERLTAESTGMFLHHDNRSRHTGAFPLSMLERDDSMLILVHPSTHKRRFGALAQTLVAALIIAVLLGTTLLFLRPWLSATGGHSPGILSLRVTPRNVALGGTITLHGSNFNANAHVGLMRDTDIAIVDTNGREIISADGSGSFSDTIFVDPNWGPGAHIIRAEDAISHKTASFTVMVTGDGNSIRPPHLQLSQTTLDLGSGDQATNNTATITLADSGGGVISWQSTATQPWLLLSPKSGTFSGNQGMVVTVAIDRSSLSPGSYSGEVIFVSTAGRGTLAVKMQVTPLDPGHEAVLQVSPAALSFTGTDGSANPPTHTKLRSVIE